MRTEEEVSIFKEIKGQEPNRLKATGLCEHVLLD